MAAPIHDMFSRCVDPAKASNCVEVRFIDNVKGKGLFAKKPLKKGGTIFIEQPLVSSQFLWNALYKYRACEYCLRALETAEENARRLSGLPALGLPQPELCKVRPDRHQACPHCQNTGEVLRLLDCWGLKAASAKALKSVHYPPETSSIMIMARMVATIKQAQNKGRWQRLFSHFCSRTANEEEEIVHKLLGEKFQGQLALLRDLFTTALYEDGQLALLRDLFTTALYEDGLSQWFTPDGFRSLFSLVGTNGQGIGTSSLSQWVHACDALELPSQQREQLDAFIDQLYKDIDTETGDFLNCEGSGLFLLQSSCNHSCVPNAEASFPDNNFLLHLGALSDISPGEEICISYLDCCQRDRSRHSRHKILRENYLFVCSCQKCMSQMDDADMTSEDEEEAEGETEDEMTDV
ncbi:SET and MYND domain-containing protein 5-like [Sinocyclocheilus anshuiensis]|uniref:SET and MYND domain-containing protein 5-like n=1 Tax=Sinocyclocheilus anshuiensis TaxID=1608454 RepID=UPI0007B8C75F|nr:PREDICTED: SET and MYND domain-containing protein 5-like [Sinocyclocheilus anshuiensis]